MSTLGQMKRVAVLGNGLLGGSIALAAAKYVPPINVSLWGRRQESINEAQSMGIEHATTDLAEAVQGVDVIILATPVGSMLDLLESVTQVSGIEGVTITDVGSVKLTPRDNLEKLVKQHGARYIGSHPMAGSEQAGISAADAELFQNAMCVITNDFDHSAEHVSELIGFWKKIGCRCHQATSEEHDRVMARISHLPHMLASVGAMVGLKHPEYGKFVGNGMRDTTRVASGHPEMWAEILLRNRDQLRQPIEESIAHLREMLAMLNNSDEEQLIRILDDAKQLRDTI